jgi:uncharacterized protein YbjT (DUF2867 family)
MAAGRHFGRLDLEAAGNFAQAAERASVQRIVYLGGLVPPKADSEHLLSRQKTGERLRAGAVPVTEIRAGIIVGPGSAAFEVIRDLVNNLPIMLTPRWVKSKSAPIALDNLLEYLVQVPTLTVTAGGIFDVAGPELLSYEQLMRQYGEVAGKKIIIIPVPVLTPRLSSYWLSLVTTVPTNIARALIGGLKYDIPADPEALRKLIPQRLLTFREAVMAALEAERRNAVAASWTEGALIFRDYRQDYAFYAKKAIATSVAKAPVKLVWHQIVSIGGKNGYYYLNFLWTLRGALDWLLGGHGLHRRRRHPCELRIGDTVDAWRVIGIESEKRLTLLFGMKAPGSSVLEFVIHPEPEQEQCTRITMTAYWHPAGIWGLLYWYALAPMHRLIFNGMVGAIAARSEEARKKITSAESRISQNTPSA